MTRKADSLQSGSAQYNANFGEDSRILALDAAEKPVEQTGWRRGWDSNPRLSFPNTRFPSVLLKPLGHLSASGLLVQTSRNPATEEAAPEVAVARRRSLLHF